MSTSIEDTSAHRGDAGAAARAGCRMNLKPPEPNRRRPGRPWSRLPEFIRAKVLEKQHDLNVDHDWWDAVYEDASTQLNHLGYGAVKIYFSGFGGQGDGAQFQARWHPVHCEPGMLKKELGKNSDWQEYADRFAVLLIRAKVLECELPTFDIKTHGDSSHEIATSFEFEYDDEEDGHEGDEQELIELSRDMMRHIYHQLEAEHDYLTSEDAIVESIEANDYHFNFEGDII